MGAPHLLGSKVPQEEFTSNSKVKVPGFPVKIMDAKVIPFGREAEKVPFIASHMLYAGPASTLCRLLGGGVGGVEISDWVWLAICERKQMIS